MVPGAPVDAVGFAGDGFIYHEAFINVSNYRNTAATLIMTSFNTAARSTGSFMTPHGSYEAPPLFPNFASCPHWHMRMMEDPLPFENSNTDESIARLHTDV